MAYSDTNGLELHADSHSHHPCLDNTVVSTNRFTAVVLIATISLLSSSIIIYYYASLATGLKEVNKDLMIQLRVV